MNDKILEQKAKEQTEVNKIFLKACISDDIDMVKYLLNSKEIPINAQLNINKITGAAKKKKIGFLPLVLSVQHNSKKVSQYFLEELNWFSQLSYDAKLEVLTKATYSNNVDILDYIFKKFTSQSSIKDYQKPFILDKLLEAVVDQHSDKAFTYLMNLPKEYLGHINTKHDQLFVKAAKSSHKILLQMLDNKMYKQLSVELYLNAIEVTKQNPETALTLFKYGLEKNIFDIFLIAKASNYIRDKVRDNVFKTFHDSVISYIHEEQIKLSSPQRLVELVNENLEYYFFTEEAKQKYNNNTNVAPVLEYVIKHNLLTKDSKENIMLKIIKQGYSDILNIVVQYPDFIKDIDLDKAFSTALNKCDYNMGKESFTRLFQIMDLDIEKKLIVSQDKWLFFKIMRGIKTTGQNYDEMVKKVFVEYDFNPDDNLVAVYEDNYEMLKLIDMKKLNIKLSQKENIQPEIKIKKNKI